MVQISTPALLSLLVATAAAADLRGAHGRLHRRGDTASVASYKTTFSMLTSLAASSQAPAPSQPAPSSEAPYPSQPAPSSEAPYPTQPAPADESTSCSEEATPPAPESTNQPYPTGSSPAASSAAPTYPTGSSPAASSAAPTYPTGSSPAASVPASSAGSSYPVGSSPAASVPASSGGSYPTGSAPAESSPASSAGSSYPVGSSPAASVPASSGGSYPTGSSPAESSPAAGSTSTKYETSYSTAYTTVTGPAPSSQECGTVTVTVTAGQSYSAMPSPPAPESSAPESSAPAPVESSSEAPSPAASTYSKSAAAQYHQASAKPKPSSGGNSGGKRGVAYNGVSNLNLGGSSNVHWAHNWGPTPNGAPKGVDYVPMCKDKSQAAQFKASAGSAKYLMSFNEVDMTAGGGGSSMSPEEAAAAYKEIMMPFADTHNVGCPSVTSHNATGDNLNGKSAASGLAYLKQFHDACKGCKVDFVPLHWYGGGEDAATQAQNFKNYMTSAISTVQSLWPGCKVWVDEFSATPTIDKDSSGVNKQFMDAVLPWLDSQPDIERYSYFAATPGLMANPDGSLTDIGKTYAS